ncbi:MAG: WYL domain-containing protein, partial [Bacteroidales bacterium]|nr:WYL domain-containing protein [Bacteroidales bacterium]
RITIKCDLSSDGGKYDFGRLESKPIHASQKSETIENEGFITIKVRPNPELYSCLMTFPHIEVISPQNVREAFCGEIRKISSHYKELLSGGE